MKQIFITGTDTGVGKTHVALTLMQQLNKEGYKTLGIKPIASGSTFNSEGFLVNEDALGLQKTASIKKPYAFINPFAFEEPIAPHLAAKKSGVQLSVKSVVDALTPSLQSEADITIIEGVGGWSVPLNNHELVSDVVEFLQIPTLLVVGIKLGCLNHAIISQQSILQSRVPLIGWVANCVDSETLVVDEIIDTLNSWLTVPLLGTVPHGKDQSGAQPIDLNLLFQN